MAPRLNCLSIFCCAEAWWNPSREPDDVLADFGRYTFGEEQAVIGLLLEEFEVVPDWGYYPPFPYSPARLKQSMAGLRPLLERIDPQCEPRLAIAPTMAEYRESLCFYADLFERLAATALDVEALTAAAKASGRVPPERAELVSLDEAAELLADPAEFPEKARLTELADGLRRRDVAGLTESYWKRVYGIYDVVPHPVDPRAQGATASLFRRFHCDLAISRPLSPLNESLKATGKPFVLVDLGLPRGERGWKLDGWPLQGDDEGTNWRASFDQPGLVARPDFRDQGYKWLVVRLTEGPKRGRKTIAVNGRVVGEFVRTGPPVTERKEWWVTRSFPIPEGLLTDGPIEIRFTDPGVAIDAVGLAADRVPDTQ